MALQNITDDGVLSWRCHHKQCPPLTANVTDPGVEWISDDLVALPPCGCGSRCFVKVKFTEEELQADNMTQYGMVPQPMELPHALTGEPVPVMIPALKPIGANPFIARHQALAAQLEACGKCPPSDDAGSEAGNDAPAPQ